MTSSTVQSSDQLSRLTLEAKVSLLTGLDSWSTRPEPSIGLHGMVLSDGPAGVRGATWDERDTSCCFPCPTALGATWDREVVLGVGRSLGVEARRKGVHVLLAPTVNLQRTPYGGRGFEAFSEDAELTAALATEYVRGVQAAGVGATVKHYVANDSETERFTVDVAVADRVLRELYLRAFEGPVVDGGAWLVMSAYNSINGVTATEHPLLTSPLQDEWGFSGVVVSDWTAVRSVESAQHPQDLAMPGPDSHWAKHLLEAVRNGEVPEAVIDRKVDRLLELARHVGAVDAGPQPPAPSVRSGSTARDVARSSAAEAMVLLANDGVLPLADPDRIAVIGEAARYPRIQGGGSATVVPESLISPVESVGRRWPEASVVWELGVAAQQGLAPLAEGSYHTPDGLPGMQVRYLDDAGREIHRETRTSSWLVWFSSTSMAARSGCIELAFTYEPARTEQRTLLGLGGVADVDVVVDGQHASTEKIRLEPGVDPSAVVLNPPFVGVELPEHEGSVELLIRFHPVAGPMPDALSLRVGALPPPHDPAVDIRRAVEAADAADVAVVVVGTSAEVESEGFDRTTLALPGAQDALVRAVANVNRRTVVVVNAGAPVLMPWSEEVAAVLLAWFPGQEFADALADVLSGDREPGGRLPMTWPGDEADVPVHQVRPHQGTLPYEEGLHVGYKAWLREGLTPAFPFGHGLGYTTFQLTDLTVATHASDGVAVAVDAANVSDRPGKCVVQVYLERESESAVERPVRWLAGFAAVRVQAHETRAIELTLPWRRFAHWESTGWHVEAGRYLVRAGLSSQDLTPPVTVELSDSLARSVLERSDPRHRRSEEEPR